MNSNDKNILDRFFDFLSVEKHKSKLTISSYKDDIDAFLESLDLTPDTFDPNLIDDEDIRQWVEAKSANEVIARSGKRRLSCLRTLWKFMLQVGYVDKDPTRLLIAPKMAKRLPTFFSEEEMVEIRKLACVDCCFELLRDNLIIELFYQTGMRCAELINLKFRDIDLYKSQLKVFGKRNKERIIPIGRKLILQLCEYTEVIETKLHIWSPFVVFDPEDGSPLEEEEVYNIVTEYMRMIRIDKKRNPHSLRHTFATQMLNNGANMNSIKELMGHTNLAATEVYTHATFQQINAMYREAHPRQISEK